jgi:hypothetical protein
LHPEINFFPSLVKANEQISSISFSKTPSNSFVSMFQILMVPSKLPENKSLPSKLVTKDEILSE